MIRKEPIQCRCRECGKDYLRLRRRGNMDRCTVCNTRLRVREWGRNNKERIKERRASKPRRERDWRAYQLTDHGREMGRLKSARWNAANGERVREQRRKNYYANRDAHIQKSVRRNKRVVTATPQWADQASIAEIYAAARRITAETGVPHEVDHIIPLLGKVVSGLHVESNLRVIPARENKRKYTRFTEADLI